MDHYAWAFSVYSRIRGYRRYRQMLSSLRRFSRDEVAQQRWRIMEFYDKYGEQATREAFGADRKVISRWWQKLKHHEGALEGLIPQSTRPKRTRTMIVAVEIVQHIRQIRQEYPRLGKEKIKPLLDEYCEKNGLKAIAESTIGKVIKHYKFFYQKAGRVYHDPSRKQPDKQKRLRVKRSPRHEDFGHIIADTVERVTDGVKDYFYNAIDAKLKFALTLNYKGLNSKNMKDFYERFNAVYPLQIKDWQTDNGSENLGEFDKTLQKLQFPICLSIPGALRSTALLNGITGRSRRSLSIITWISSMISPFFMNISPSIWSSISPREFISHSIR